MATQKVIGVIGLGSIGMRHAKNLELLGCKVIGYDPEESKRSQFTGLALAEEAYVIASPTPNHLEHLWSCVDTKKPFFVEKPIANQMDASLYRATMVGYNLRFHSCVKKAKKWLDDGLIGGPLWASFTCAQFNSKPAYLRDGVILNWSHEIDLALYLLGNAKVAASSTRIVGGNDDMTDILLTHDSGCRSTIHLDYVTDPEFRSFVIHGTKGQIIADLVTRTAWLNDDVYRAPDSWDDNYIEEMQAFLARIDGQKTLGCTAEEAIKVLDICLEVRKQAGLP